LPDDEVIEQDLSQESVLLSNFQLSVINMEYMLPGVSGDTLDTRIDRVMIQVLEEAGFDVVSRANNHAWDYGLEGLRYNAKRLTEAGFALIGTRESSVYEWTVDGHTVAIYALTEFLDREDEEGYIPRIIETDLQFMRELTKECDFRIAFVHLGSLSSYISPHEHSQAARLLEYGADLVVCTGNHYIKGYVTEKGKPVFYGIGNHLFSELAPNTEPIGMHVVAGFHSGRFVQLFGVPFRNAIREGRTGPLDPADFSWFTTTLAERSVAGSEEYFSDPRILQTMWRRLRTLDFGGRSYTPRHITYGVRILFHNYPVITSIAFVVLLTGAGLFLRWIVLLRRKRILRTRRPASLGP
jgi:hypothetical protein